MALSTWARVARASVGSVGVSAHARRCMRATTKGLAGRICAQRWASATAHAEAVVEAATSDTRDRAAPAKPLDGPEEIHSDQPQFSTLKSAISPETLKALTVKPFQLKYMSPVQAAVLPLLPDLADPYDSKATQCRDLLVRAKTGTGKTLAFLVPAMEARVRALKASGRQAVQDSGVKEDRHLEERAIRRLGRTEPGCLIISPTRELATQIANEALRLSAHHPGYEVRLFVGGTSKRMQMRDWMKGRRDIVVGTPGRIRDLLENEPEVRDDLVKAKTLILDEADTLLEMGFRDDLDAIVSSLPPSPERQTFMFSATVSPQIRQVARAYLTKNHKFINCVDESAPPVHLFIPQYHTVLPSSGDQIPHILRLLAHDQMTHPGNSKTIMFLPTTKMTQLYATVIRQLMPALPAHNRATVYEMHSKLEQRSRDRVASLFRASSSGSAVLVTSDVSARGLDYPGTTRVIQVGIPSSPDQYVHRAGRTGRGKDKTGRVDLVLLPWEVGYVTWKLTDIPLKPLTTSELENQVKDLAQRLDEGEITGGHFNRPYTPTLGELPERIKTLLSKLDETAIEETMMSLFGYYAGQVDDLRIQRQVLVDGLKEWTMGAMGLERAPFVPQDFLNKMGMADRRNARGNDRPRDMLRPHWMGRGSQKSKGREYERGSRYDRDRGFGGDRGFGRDRESGGDREFGGGRGSGGDREFGGGRGSGGGRGWGEGRRQNQNEDRPRKSFGLSDSH